MNNAFIIKNSFEDSKKDPKPQLRERAEQVGEIIEALQNIASSSYWLVLKKNVFDVEIRSAKKSLAIEDDPTKMFRLQGEVRWENKINLEKLLTKYRNELQTINSKLNV
jgi:hypothetical protein